jgi:hypothetical protein
MNNIYNVVALCGGADMVIYIAGRITGELRYREKFAAAEQQLKEKGYTVLNPAMLPEGMKPEKYLPICMAMIDAADAIYFLRNWRYSRGALVEHDYAIYQGKVELYE